MKRNIARIKAAFTIDSNNIRKRILIDNTKVDVNVELLREELISKYKCKSVHFVKENK